MMNVRKFTLRLSQLSSTSMGNYLRGHRTFFNNLSWMLFDKLLMMGMSLLIGIVVARYLGPSQMGIWGYTQSLSAMLAVFGTLSIQQIAIRDLVQIQKDPHDILGSIIGVRLVGGTFIFLILISIGLISNDFNIRWLLILLGATHLFLAFDSYDFWFQAKILARYGVVARIIGQILLVAAKLTLVYLQAPLIWFGIVTLAATILQAGLFIVFGRLVSSISLFQLRFTFNKVKYLLQQCWPLILSGLATSVYVSSDTVILRHFASNDIVGLYTVASNLAYSSMFIVVVVCQASYPIVLKARTISKAAYRYRLMQLYTVSFWLAFVLGSLLAIASKWFIPMLFGPSYALAVTFFQILCAMSVFNAIMMVSSFWLMAEGLQKYSFYRNLVGMTANILLNVLLIPKYGGVGAALTSVAASAMATVGFMVLVPRLRGQLNLVGHAINPRQLLRANGYLLSLVRREL